MKATFKFNGYKVTVKGKRMYVTYKPGGMACGSVLDDMTTLAKALGVTVFAETFNSKTFIAIK